MKLVSIPVCAYFYRRATLALGTLFIGAAYLMIGAVRLLVGDVDRQLPALRIAVNLAIHAVGAVTWSAGSMWLQVCKLRPIFSLIHLSES